MPPDRWKWINLTTGLPGYVTNAPASVLKEDQTPDAQGLDMTALGYLKKGSIPTSETRMTRSYDIGEDSYYYYYRRLWRVSENRIIYGATGYTEAYFAQASGRIDLNDVEDTVEEETVEQPVVGFCPIGLTSLIFFKADGAYIVKDASRTDAFFFLQDYIQDAHVSTDTHFLNLDGTVYFVNTLGFFSVAENGQVTDLSLSITGNVTPAALTADYENKYIMIGTSLAYDIREGKFFKYNGTDFDYKSRKLVNSDNSTLSVSDIEFEFDKTSTASGEIRFRYQTEERGLSDREYVITVDDVRNEKEKAHMVITPEVGLSWQLKLTSIPDNLKIKNIWVRVKGYTQESRDS